MRWPRGRHRLRLQRLEITALICLLPFAVIIPRLAWLQLVQGGKLDVEAEHQRIRRVWIPPDRGDILDRNGERFAYSVMDTAGKREMRRVYPYGSRASQVLGYLNWKNEGKSGIEMALDAELSGHPGWATEVLSGNASDRYILPKSRRKGDIRGVDVILTLDAALQDIAASELEDAVRSLQAESGVVVAVDPRTGDILAMAGYPSFDPQRVKKSRPEDRRLRAITDMVEPGSTGKIIPALTALQDHLLTPESVLHCENGRFRIGRRLIEDHKPFGILTFRDCFAQSSNIGFAKIGLRCGCRRLFETAQRLGFGNYTGICLDGESRGKLHALSTWRPNISPASVAIGYEFQVTPLQLTMAYAAIANDGVLMRPRLLKSLEKSGKTVFEARPLAVGRVAEPAVTRILMDFFRETVEHGTGTLANVPWARVGGKTGTARMIVNNEYSRNHHRATFVGVAPLDDPRIVLTVMIDDPKVHHYGGSAAAPTFSRILETYARVEQACVQPEYAAIIVDQEASGSLLDLMSVGQVWAKAEKQKAGTPMIEGGLPDVRGMSKRMALLAMGDRRVTTDGTGVVISQRPAPGLPHVAAVHLVCGTE